MAIQRRPAYPRATDDLWSQIPASNAMEGINEAIERAKEKLILVSETGAVLRYKESIDGKADVILVLTFIQELIMEALAGRLLTKEELAVQVCGGHGSQLYRNGDIQELVQLKFVAKRRGGGYYLPNDPPPTTLVCNL